MKILAWATARRDLAAKIEENTRNIILHLIKLYLFPDAQEVPHWRNEVYSMFWSISSLKGNNKFPSATFILRNTILLNLKHVLHLHNMVIDDYADNHTIRSYTLEELTYAIEEYYDWLATQLSKKGSISRKACYNKLKELNFGD